MSLQRLLEGCTELADLTADRWNASSPAEREAFLARAKQVKEDIRHASKAHNSAVLKTMRRRHPEDPHVQPDKLKDAVEHLQTDWEMIAIPTDVACLDPLPVPDDEAKLEGLPAEVRALHRYAVIVRNQVGTLLVEAENVHEANRHGEHAERIPAPRRRHRGRDEVGGLA